VGQLLAAFVKPHLAELSKRWFHAKRWKNQRKNSDRGSIVAWGIRGHHDNVYVCLYGRPNHLFTDQHQGGEVPKGEDRETLSKSCEERGRDAREETDKKKSFHKRSSS